MYFYEQGGEWLPVPVPVPLYQVVRAALLNALAYTDGHQLKAAQLLGISPRAISYQLAAYHITGRPPAGRAQNAPTVYQSPTSARKPRSPKERPGPRVVLSTCRRFWVRWVGVIEATSAYEAARAARGAAFYNQTQFDVREGLRGGWQEIDLDAARPMRVVR